MNAATASPGFGSTGRLVGGLVILIVAAVLLYYLYDYLFNITQIKKKADIITGPIAVSDQTLTFVYPSDKQSGINLNNYIYTGGEMSLSFWIYVTGFPTAGMSKKHILHLGPAEEGATSPTLIVSLGSGQNNALFVKVNDGSNPISDLNTYMASTGSSDMNEACNILNFEFGRWVNVTTVLNNNLCDVYVDGKLARSCVLKGQYQVSNAAGTTNKLYIAKPKFGTSNTAVLTDWKGSLSGVAFYNYAISPDEVYRIYMAGPSGASGDLWAAIKAFFAAGEKVEPVL